MTTQKVTKGIVLRRTNYHETDRVITVLSSDFGKLHLLARGVRKINSKLSGGIELLSVSNISFITGKGDLGTLTSSRLIEHYSNIPKDIERTMLTYDILKMIDKLTEDELDSSWFNLLKQTLTALDDINLDQELVFSWFKLQLLKLSGHSPDLYKDSNAKKLKEDVNYRFDFNGMVFQLDDNGPYNAHSIKYIRIVYSAHDPKIIQKIELDDKTAGTSKALVDSITNLYLG